MRSSALGECLPDDGALERHGVSLEVERGAGRGRIRQVSISLAHAMSALSTTTKVAIAAAAVAGAAIGYVRGVGAVMGAKLPMML